MPYYSIGGRSRLRLESRDAPHYSMAIAGTAILTLLSCPAYNGSKGRFPIAIVGGPTIL